jgi:hypothetical protein
VASEPVFGEMAGGKSGDVEGSGVKGDGVVVQRIVHEMGTGRRSRCSARWAMLMRVKLKACGLWVIIDKGDVDP